ncbi:unnamed protein product, partial [Ectocarpus sp. 12 AP-2014]
MFLTFAWTQPRNLGHGRDSIRHPWCHRCRRETMVKWALSSAEQSGGWPL